MSCNTRDRRTKKLGRTPYEWHCYLYEKMLEEGYVTTAEIYDTLGDVNISAYLIAMEQSRYTDGSLMLVYMDKVRVPAINCHGRHYMKLVGAVKPCKTAWED